MNTAPLVMAAAPAFGAPADISKNTQAILARIAEAKKHNARLLVLPELSLSGGNAGSLMQHQVFLDAIKKATFAIANACQGLVCIFGLPLPHKSRLYNALCLVSDGKFAGFVIKQHLSREDLGIFSPGLPDQVQWLGQPLPAGHQAWLPWPGQREDAILVRFYQDLLPPFVPLQAHQVLALAAREPATAGVEHELPGLLASAYAPDSLLAYANAGANESTTDLVYSGLAFIASSGQVLSMAAPFSLQAATGRKDDNHQQVIQNTPTPAHRDLKIPYAPPEGEARAIWCRDCITIAAWGLARRTSRIKASTITLGVSGGLDSAMALVIAKKAFEILELPATGIKAYSLPAFGSSTRTKKNARLLVEALGLPYREIDLKDSLLQHFRDINHPENLHDVVFENAQARERTQVLMDLANQAGGLMVGSGDLSELALGFTTYGGDHMSMYGVNAGLYKTAIRLILAQVADDNKNSELQQVLLDILETPVSPELLPHQDGQIVQQTENILGSYLLNDFFLHHFLSGQQSPQDILSLADAAFGKEISSNEIKQRLVFFLKRFFHHQFKRNCMPDSPQVLGVSLSPRGGFSLPSDAAARVWLNALAAQDARPQLPQQAEEE